MTDVLAVRDVPEVTVAHLAEFAHTFTDLADSEVMKGAWE